MLVLSAFLCSSGGFVIVLNYYLDYWLYFVFCHIGFCWEFVDLNPQKRDIPFSLRQAQLVI